MSTQTCRYGLVLVLAALVAPSCDGSTGQSTAAADVQDTVADGSAAAEPDGGAGEVKAPEPPERVRAFPEELPYSMARVADAGEPPAASEVHDFSGRMGAFFRDTEFWTWARRHAHGVAEDNPWGEPGYLFWWQDVEAVKQDGVVTFRHEGGADNMMAWHGRVVGPVVGAYLTMEGARDPGPIRELVLGYIQAVSATLTGSIWADEDPPVETIMARGIFHRNHTWTLDGGRQAAVDYEPDRHVVYERRHDTLHNPQNPTWGDIYVRNKRSKDDFPWVYRFPVHLSHLLWHAEDPEIRDAALTLWDQLQGFAADIVDHGYLIRAKAEGGEVFIPYMEGTDVVDDFATLVAYEELLPNAECNAKLAVALLATGTPLDNACDDGVKAEYEEIALSRYYGHTWMQWGFHIAAVATSLLYGADEDSEALLAGLGARLDALMVRDDSISDDPRYRGDLAQTLVQAATWGLPLTADEAALVISEYRLAADHYEPWTLWDLWSAEISDGTYPVYPPRDDLSRPETKTAPGAFQGVEVDAEGKVHIWIPEMANLFEYCASPLRATTGALFLDCEVFLDAQGPGVAQP